MLTRAPLCYSVVSGVLEMHAPHCWNTASKAWLSALAHTHTHANTQQGTAKGGEKLDSVHTLLPLLYL